MHNDVTKASYFPFDSVFWRFMLLPLVNVALNTHENVVVCQSRRRLATLIKLSGATIFCNLACEDIHTALALNLAAGMPSPAQPHTHTVSVVTRTHIENLCPPIPGLYNSWMTWFLTVVFVLLSYFPGKLYARANVERQIYITTDIISSCQITSAFTPLTPSGFVFPKISI